MIKMYRDMIKTYRDMIKMYRDTIKMYRDMIKTYRDIIETYICLYVKHPSFLSGINETSVPMTDFRKILKSPENPYRGSRPVPCGQTHGQT